MKTTQQIKNIFLKNNYLQSGLFYIAARPGIGKTTFLLDVMLSCISNTNNKIILFSPEKKEKEIFERICCKFDEPEKVVGLLNNKNIIIEDFTNIENSNLFILKTIENNDDINIVFIDYLDCLWKKGKGKKITYTERDSFLEELRLLAKKKNITIIVSNYISLEEYNIFLSGVKDRFMSLADNFLLLDRTTLINMLETCDMAKLYVAKTAKTNTFDLKYNGIKRRFEI